jgi:Zn-dependent M28 family amino/carboxypeptidase
MAMNAGRGPRPTEQSYASDRPRQARATPVLLLVASALITAASCARSAPETLPRGADRAAVARALLTVLAADSLQGRRTGTPGSARAARFIAATLERYGIKPAGDSAYFQRVPTARDVNVIGIVPGADPVLRNQAIVVGAHFDHLGVGRPIGNDSIYNGADDDGSGVVAVLGVARALAAGPPPKRTVVLLLTTGEEVGLLGTRWYLEHPVVPLDRTVADLQIEMIGRPDPLVGAHGIPVVADPRPEQRFFERSDNIAFAWRGIPAHTISSYGMHPEYHTPSDEVSRIDFNHMAQVINATIHAVRLLADGAAVEWKPGGSPEKAAAK